MTLNEVYLQAVADEVFLLEKVRNIDEREFFLLSLTDVNEDYFLKKAFIDNEIQESKQFLYVIALVEAYYSEVYRRDIFGALNTFVFPILSDNKSIIDRYIKYDSIDYYDDFSTSFGKCIQSVILENKDNLSLNIKVLEKYSKRGWEKQFSGLVNAFKGFLYKDKILVENGIDELLSKHNKQEQPKFIKDFINYEATTIAKLANYAGLSLNVEHKLIPKELLPIQPLEHYKIPYDFLKEINWEI